MQARQKSPIPDDDRFREALGVRIASIADRLPSKKAAASAAGVTAEQLNKWIAGTVKVPVDGLMRLSSVAGVDFSWAAAGDVGDLPAATDQPDMVAIPRYDEVRPSAGFGALIIDETVSTRVFVELRWLLELGASPGSTVILPAGGDSMEPTICNGAPMFVDTSKREVRNGHIYVFSVDGDLVVKRIERLLDGSFDLISDNKRYPTRNLSQATVDTLTVIGCVLAAISTF